jgi:hypothetical protein
MPTLVSRGLSFVSFRQYVQAGRWKTVFKNIAHVLLVWSFALKDGHSFTLCYDMDVFRCMVRDFE